MMQDDSKNILLLNRSLWPDIEATGQFLTELCEDLSKKYRVTTIAGSSYYSKEKSFKPWQLYSVEEYKDVKILRVRHTRFWKRNLVLRIINWLTYSILAFIAAMRGNYDLIIVCTDPPFLGIIAMVISRLRYIPYIYNCRDLYPDVAWGLGRLKKTNIFSHLFNHLNTKALQKASLVICLGQSMAEKIKAKGIRKKKIRVISDWVDAENIKPMPRERNPLIEKFGLRGKFIIMHSGNIGLSQDFNLLLKSISMIENNSAIYLIFIGGGAGRDKLKNRIGLLGIKNVLFLPYQPQDMLSYFLGMADLHIITLKKGMAGAIVPSKVYGIMAVAKPYLAITDKESEPARLVEEFGCGLWAKPDDLGGVADNIKWALNHREELKEMGNVGRRLVETKFDKNIVVNEWFELLSFEFHKQKPPFFENHFSPDSLQYTLQG